MSNIRFVATPLAGANKTGILRPNANGYYRMYVGALNVINSAGMYYPYEAAKHIFTDGSSEFMRRVADRSLRGELGHPKRLPGMTDAQFFGRLLSIYEDNVCVFFNEIILDFENSYDEQGNKVIGILADLMPDGVHANVLQRQIDNPDANCSFSIRSFTRDHLVGAMMHRDIKKVVTFDNVNEPGIGLAKKKYAPGLENRNVITMDSGDELIVSQGTVEEAIRQAKMAPGLESRNILEVDLFKQFGWTDKQVRHIENRAANAAWNSW